MLEMTKRMKIINYNGLKVLEIKRNNPEDVFQIIEEIYRKDGIRRIILP